MLEDDLERNRELDQKIDDLQHNRVRRSKLLSTIWELGKEEYQPARPIIERFVTDQNVDVRIAALTILINRFGARDRKYWEMARDLLKDPLTDNRIEGANLLRIFARDTQDGETLRLLAPIVKDPEEERGVRRAAYLALRSVVHFNPFDGRDIINDRFDIERDTDWELVNKYLSGNDQNVPYGFGRG